MKKILFICKKNETYGFVSYTRRSSGLYNSTRFITESLVKHGVDAKIVEVVDNNCIDREVNEFKPDIVVLEALWVVPTKFYELKPLHPKVKWFVHLHSHMPFLALEGIAMQWINEYIKLGVGIIANSTPSYNALKPYVGHDTLVYLPNVYISHPTNPERRNDQKYINIGCFGAVRPMKNQLLQALAAIQYAKEVGKKLRFHLNASRTETGGDQVLKNILELFARTPNAELIQHGWHEPEDFLFQLRNKIDIALQVSMTETFCVVAADAVTAGVPTVVSKEVSWMSRWSKAKDDDIQDIVDKMHRAYKNRWLIKRNQCKLLNYSKKAQGAWLEFVMNNL